MTRWSSTRGAALAIMLVSAPSASATVLSSGDTGFVTESSAEVPLSPVEAYALVVTPARWWNGAHSYSGDAHNLTIDPRAGGCFCETLPAKEGKPAGSVEHGRVVMAMPGATLRLSGALGPLQGEALVGTLTFSFVPVGTGTKVMMRYVVGGYVQGGAARFAPMVDQVLSEQFQGLVRAAKAPAEG
ncbi:ATPase [Sphingobium sp. H39-3-25]|uniref:ATPase n=1 Tax=Sphingobium arseniciresistens TaxID=3030834 RepID=UPI0023B9DADB|nr:ATPase [Sphingobium arseniciresistens]